MEIALKLFVYAECSMDCTSSKVYEEGGYWLEQYLPIAAQQNCTAVAVGYHLANNLP